MQHRCSARGARRRVTVRRPGARDHRIQHLRCHHLTYREIGEELGIDLSTAYDAVQRTAQMIPTEGAAEMTQAMLDELDRMSRHLWGVVERPESDDSLGRRQTRIAIPRRLKWVHPTGPGEGDDLGIGVI